MYSYLDGEMIFWRRWAMARHIRTCGPCEEMFTYEVKVQQVVATRCSCEEAPIEVRQKIIEALVTEGCPPPKSS